MTINRREQLLLTKLQLNGAVALLRTSSYVPTVHVGAAAATQTLCGDSESCDWSDCWAVCVVRVSNLLLFSNTHQAKPSPLQPVSPSQSP